MRITHGSSQSKSHGRGSFAHGPFSSLDRIDHLGAATERGLQPPNDPSPQHTSHKYTVIPYNTLFPHTKSTQGCQGKLFGADRIYAGLKTWSSGPGQRILALPGKYCHTIQESECRSQNLGDRRNGAHCGLEVDPVAPRSLICFTK